MSTNEAKNVTNEKYQARSGPLYYDAHLNRTRNERTKKTNETKMKQKVHGETKNNEKLFVI